MINVSDYWRLPSSDKASVRDEVKEYENDLQMVVGHYQIELEAGDTIWFNLFCMRCFRMKRRTGYTAITKEEYLDPKHEMYGHKCQGCKLPLA
jgi:hypothetical protein